MLDILEYLESYKCLLLRLIKNPPEVACIASETKFGIFRHFIYSDFSYVHPCSFCQVKAEGG